MTQTLKTAPTDSELPNRGPRIMPADIEANIEREAYFTAHDGAVGARLAQEGGTTSTPISFKQPELHLLTFCVLVLRNGFTVTGESACAAPENFDAEIGKRIARAQAVQKIWALMGYELRSKLKAAEKPVACPHAAPFVYCQQCVTDPCPIGLGKQA